MTCGKTLRFWNLTGEDLRSQRGMWGETARSSSVTCVAAVDSNVVAGTAWVIVWAGHHLMASSASGATLTVSSTRTSKTTCSGRGPRTVPEPLASLPGSEERGRDQLPARLPSVFGSRANHRGCRGETTSLRMLSGDDSGLIVLWACLPDHLPKARQTMQPGPSEARKPVDVDSLLTPLLMLSTGQLRVTDTFGGSSLLPEWVKVEVTGIDATRFEDRYDKDGAGKESMYLSDEEAAAAAASDFNRVGDGRGLPTVMAGNTIGDPEHSARLLKVSPAVAEVRALCHRNGYLLVGTQSNEIFEVNLDTIRAELMNDKTEPKKSGGSA